MDGTVAHTDLDPVKQARTRREQVTSIITARRTRLIAGLVVLLIAVALIVNFLMDRARYVSTADARIASDMIAVSTDISGRITSVTVGEGQRVAKGDVMFTIDDREAIYTLAEYEAEAARLRAQIAREETRASLATTKAGSEVAARSAGTLSASAAVAGARSDYETALRDYERTQDLFERGRVAQAALDQAQNTLDTSEQALRRAEAERQRAAAEQRTANVTVEEVQLIDLELPVLRAALEQAEARVAAQEVTVSQHKIVSPIDGVVDEIFYDEGEHSLRGFRMALLHNPDSVRVSANIKETDIRHVAIGAPVEIKVDSYPGLDLSGTVAQIHDATIAEAALMPNPNANGVFTKITQRIAVRIEIDTADVPLRPGTMVQIRIRKQSDDEQR